MRIHKAHLSIAAIAIVAGVACAGSYYFISRRPPLPSNSELGGFKGIVVNGLTNTPISGAQIKAVHTQNLNAEKTVVSDESGRFALELPDGEYTVSVAHEAFVSRGKDDDGRRVFIEDGTQFVNAKMRLWPPAKLHGRVVAGQAGIHANIEIQYTKDASGNGPYTYRSLVAAEDGYFTLDTAYAGIVSVGISADGFASVELDDIVLKSGISLDLGDIPLRDGVSLYGNIVDFTSKHGIANAQIEVKNAAGTVLATTQSSSDGSYRLPPLDMTQIAVDITANGYHPEHYQMRLGGNANRELSANLKRAWGMTLHIQNTTGRDPIQTHVRIVDVTTDTEVYSEVLKNGVYKLDAIKGGPFLVESASADRLTTQTKRVKAGDDVYIRLKPFAQIHATALDSDGNRIPSGQYRFYFRPDTTTDDDSPTPWLSFSAGEFDVTDLNEGFYRIEVMPLNEDRIASSPEFLLKNGDVKNLSIQLTQGGALRGHVVSSIEGYNLAMANVSLSQDGETKRTTTTDKDGYFTFDKLTEKSFSLQIIPTREDGEGKSFGPITVPPDQLVEQEFRVDAPKTEKRENKRARMRERFENGEYPKRPKSFDPKQPFPTRRGHRQPPPNWDGNGEPPMPPDWDGNGEPPMPPDWDGNGEPPMPPDWDGNGEPPMPPDWDGNADPIPSSQEKNAAPAPNKDKAQLLKNAK